MSQNLLLEKTLDFFDKYKVSLALGLIGLILIGLGFLIPKITTSREPIKITSSKEDKPKSLIKVDVSGAVKQPGVYELYEEDRVLDAIYKAGGFSSEVDSNFVASQLNLAAKITDGQKVYVKRVGETVGTNITDQVSTQSRLVNINSASEKDLDTLPGVGEVTAQKIIAARPYQQKEDLLNKKIVGKSTFEKIKDLISVY
jgi:competence protein ComEA